MRSFFAENTENMVKDADEKRLEQLLEVQAHRLKHEPHRYYVPIGKGEEFIDLIGSGKYIVVLLSAANGIGKTWLAANLLANMFWKNDNKYFQHEFFRNFPYPKQGRIVSDPTTVTDTIIPTLEKVFPKGRYNVQKVETSKDGKRYEYHWKTDTGWEFNIMSYEQDVGEFESATLGWCWFDEPPPEHIYKATIARFRMGGFAFITATPLTGSAWIYDQIVTNNDNEKEFRAFVEAEVEDACKEHGVRGFLDHEQIVKMISQYSEEDKQARVFGKFQHLTGLVFKTWNRKIHVVRPFSVDRRDFSVLELLDPHPRNPDALMWLATRKDGVKFVVDEIYDTFNSTGELAGRVKAIAKNYRIEERRADQLAWNKDQHRGVTRGRSLAEELAELDLDYMPASKDRQNGIRLVQNALSYEIMADEDVTRFIKPPVLFVFDTCVRTIWEFEHWQYQEWTGKTSEYKSRSERPQDKDDHQMENLGRGFLNDIGFVPYRPPREPVHPLSIAEPKRSAIPNLDPYS